MNDKLREYIEKGLKDDGYDGLYNEAIECGCGIDDLMPCQDAPSCDGFPEECEPAYKVRKKQDLCKNLKCEVQYCHGHCFRPLQYILDRVNLECWKGIKKEVQP